MHAPTRITVLTHWYGAIVLTIFEYTLSGSDAGATSMTVSHAPQYELQQEHAPTES